MKVKVTIKDIGNNHARLEVEDECDVGGIGRLLKRINNELSGNRASTTPFAKINSTPQRNANSNPEMASAGAIHALWGAAKHNGTDVETVCKKYGVDPNRISKSDCWQMTQELNARSGYSKNRREQPSDKNGGDSFFD